MSFIDIPGSPVAKARGAFASLRQFVNRGASEKPAARCELCSQAIAVEHDHLLEIAKRQVACACEPCAILFSNHAEMRYRRIPRDSRWLSGFVLPDEQWESLAIPINLAFFFDSSVAQRVVAYYPGPAGATESLLHLEDWDTIVERNPVLRQMQPDVEALLVNRISASAASPAIASVRPVGEGAGATDQHFLVPIDECYRLVGVIRTHWRGLSGGHEVWKQIATFFAELRRRSREVQCA